MRRALIASALATLCAGTVHADSDRDFEMRTLSSKPNLASGGDALV